MRMCYWAYEFRVYNSYHLGLSQLNHLLRPSLKYITTHTTIYMISNLFYGRAAETYLTRTYSETMRNGVMVTFFLNLSYAIRGRLLLLCLLRLTHAVRHIHSHRGS